jgi:hypothetical protein
MPEERAEMIKEITLNCPNINNLEENFFLMSAENEIIKRTAKFCRDFMHSKN